MASENGNLAGKVAIITGGGTGMGKGIALALAGQGADIAVAGRRSGPIEETAQEAIALGRKALAITTDITDSRQVDRLAGETLARLGRIDILVNNAGMVRAHHEREQQRKPIWEVTDEEWRLGMEANLTGAFYCCRAVARHLVAQKSGTVINMASAAGLRGGRGNYMYHVGKGGVIQLTRCLALTWAGDNIQVNCIVPGVIDTAGAQPEPGELPAGIGDLIPVGRVGTMDDINSLVLFLASGASPYLTGSLFIVDGGGLTRIAPIEYVPLIPIEEV